MEMKKEREVETETAMETETETDNTRTWTGPRTRTWNWQTFAKYFIRRNCPYSTIWNASEISRRNFQWRCILVTPLHYENNDMKIFKKFIPLLE